MKLVLLITVSLLVRISNCGFADSDAGLDFDIEDDDQSSSQNSHANKEQALQATMLHALQKPAVREQIGQVIPILRAMSPQQRLTLAALVSAQVMAPQRADHQSLNDVASLFGSPGESPKNVSEKLLLPISMDIAKMFRGMGVDAGRSWRSAPVPWDRRPAEQRTQVTAATVPPTMDTFNFTVSKGSIWKTRSTTATPNDINRRNYIEDEFETSPESTDCEYFTSDMCLEVNHYPEAEILSSIQKQLPLMESFLSEYGDMRNEGDSQQRIQRRRDGGNDLGSGEGYMCPSTVKYAQPKRARTTSGVWKYVVNTGEYTQTLRLEMCMKPGASCSYLQDNFRSVCNQVFNYHRLMTWDEKRGLHMDVFKVPSCCSCHVQGYSAAFPPADYPFAEKRKEVLPVQSSSSGVKREIPRPGRPGSSAQYQNLHTHPPLKKENQFSSDFSIEPSISISDYQHIPPSQTETLSQTNPFYHNSPTPQFYTTTQSPGLIQSQREPLQNLQQQKLAINQNLPLYPEANFNGNPDRPFNKQKLNVQISPFSPQQQGYFQNGDTQGSSSVKNSIKEPFGLVDHLVPPGPPLPLEHERRPFDQRRRNMTSIRYQDADPNDKKFNRDTTVTKNNAAGTNIPMTIPVSMPANPTRASIRPPGQMWLGPTIPNDNNRHQTADNTKFGTKIQGKKPSRPNRPVFVTPTPFPGDKPAVLDNFVKVTPKPPKYFPNSPSKKINYNYHPIIDFFSKDHQFNERNFHVQPSPNRNRPHQQMNHPLEARKSLPHKQPVMDRPTQVPPKHPQQKYSQPDIQRQTPNEHGSQFQHHEEIHHQTEVKTHQQHIQSDHEWTPML